MNTEVKFKGFFNVSSSLHWITAGSVNKNTYSYDGERLFQVTRTKSQGDHLNCIGTKKMKEPIKNLKAL